MASVRMTTKGTLAGSSNNTTKNTTTGTTTGNTTGSSTQRDTGTIKQETLVPAWALAGVQNQYNQADQRNQQAGNFYSSVLQGNNAEADVWSERMFKQLLQQATGAPGFTETGAAAQGIAAGEAMAASEAAMFQKMMEAATGIQSVGQNTVPFLDLAGQWAPKQETRDLTSTKNWNENSTGSSNTTSTTVGPKTSSTKTVLGGSGATGTGYQGPKTYVTNPGAPLKIHPSYALFLQQQGINPNQASELLGGWWQ